MCFDFLLAIVMLRKREPVALLCVVTVCVLCLPRSRYRDCVYLQSVIVAFSSHDHSLFGHFQGGKSRGQHGRGHGFPEPVKLFVTFVILSQISCGKVQNTLIFVCSRLCQSFSLVCCSFQD